MSSRTWRAWGLGLIVGAALAAAARAEQTFDFRGVLSARGGAVLNSPESWLTGSLGKFQGGGDGVGEDAAFADADLRLGFDWAPHANWRIRFDGVARWEVEPRTRSSRDFGIVELWGEGFWTVAGDDEFGFRLGHFFLPTSRENVDPFWGARYTLTTSALNSWIGEEVRPLGLDLHYDLTADAAGSFQFAATAIRSNDSAGALLAWRGWSFGHRVTTWGEVVPLAPLGVLETGAFRAQNNQGTQPFGSDVDGKTGWSARFRWRSADERWLAQTGHFDNGGNGKYRGGDWAWDTHYTWIGGEVRLDHGVSILTEWARGNTFAISQGGATDVDFQAGYLLASWKRGPSRWTLRHDRFRTTDRDRGLDDNDENGTAWTLAWLIDVTERWRLGFEAMRVNADRPIGSSYAGTDDVGGESLLVELRYRFGD